MTWWKRMEQEFKHGLKVVVKESHNEKGVIINVYHDNEFVSSHTYWYDDFKIEEEIEEEEGLSLCEKIIVYSPALLFGIVFGSLSINICGSVGLCSILTSFLMSGAMGLIYGGFLVDPVKDYLKGEGNE